MKANRSEIIDCARGVLLLNLFFNHTVVLFSSTSYLWKLSYQLLGYVSLAELFLCVSAISSVKSNESNKNKRKNITRFIHLYKYYVSTLTLVFILSWKAHHITNHSLPELLKSIYYITPTDYFLGFILLNYPPLFHIFPLYMVLSLASPYLINLINKKSFYPLIISFLAWLPIQFISIPKEIYNIKLPYFNLFSWVFLYISLLYIYLNREYLISKIRFFLPLSLFFTILLLIDNHYHFLFLESDYIYLGREKIGIIRLINTVSIFVLLIISNIFFKFNSIYYYKITKLLKWAGLNSLELFCLHIIVIYIYKLFSFQELILFNQHIDCILIISCPFILEYFRETLFREAKSK